LRLCNQLVQGHQRVVSETWNIHCLLRMPQPSLAGGLNVKPGTVRHRALASYPPFDPKAPVVALIGAWFFSPAPNPTPEAKRRRLINY
jgi:hypothetical protein